MLVIDNNFALENKGIIRHLISKKLGVLSKEELDLLYVDTIIKCILNAQYYNPEYSINTFIGLQVRSAVADMMAKREGERGDALHGVIELMPEHDTPVEEDEDDEETMSFLRERLAPYMHVLSDNERSVIVNHVWGRRGVNDIAERLGLNASSVSTIKTRAVTKLRTAIGKGKRVNAHQQVDADLPLEHAIKQLPDAQYHAYRLHKLKGWSLTRVASIMGRRMLDVVHLVEDAQREIAMRWGYRA